MRAGARILVFGYGVFLVSIPPMFLRVAAPTPYLSGKRYWLGKEHEHEHEHGVEPKDEVLGCGVVL